MTDAKKLVAEAHAVCEYSELPGHDKAVELGDNPGGCEHGLMHEKVAALGNALEAAHQEKIERICRARIDERQSERTRIVKRLRVKAATLKRYGEIHLHALADEIEAAESQIGKLYHPEKEMYFERGKAVGMVEGDKFARTHIVKRFREELLGSIEFQDCCSHSMPIRRKIRTLTDEIERRDE